MLMIRTLLPGVVLLALATNAEAQGKPAPSAEVARQFIGTWEGPYQSEAVPPGSLKLVIAQDEKQQWKVTLEVISDQPPAAGEVRDFTVEAGTVSWVQDISEMLCRSVAKLVAGVLKGDAECSQGGAVVLTASFLLEKKKP
jgi:hypothetical protein